MSCFVKNKIKTKYKYLLALLKPRSTVADENAIVRISRIRIDMLKKLGASLRSSKATMFVHTFSGLSHSL